MARALDRMTGKHNIEVLKVGVVTTFAVGWLMPRLVDFRQAHPEIDLRISTNNNRVEILREGLDMAIRFGSGRWTGTDATPLFETPVTALCAPSVASQLRTPHDLGREILLRSYRTDEWPCWFREAGAVCPLLTGPVLDSSIALASLAGQGAGVALLPVAMFARQIEDGQLQQPFNTSVSVGMYYLTSPTDRYHTEAMIAFAKWLSSQCAYSPVV